MIRCPICGKEKSALLPFIEGICISCYLEKNPVEPITIKIKTCKSCGAIFLKGKWEPEGGRKLNSIIIREAERILRKKFGPYGFEVFVSSTGDSFKAQVFGKEGSYSFPIKVEIVEEKSICPLCLAKRSGVYEAKIQVRSNEGKIDKAVFNEVMRIISSLPLELRENVVSIDELREGFDINLKDKASAKILATAISNKLGGNMKLTHKLISERGGEKRTRLSISLRIPISRKGGIFEIYGEPAILMHKTGEPLRLYLLNRKREIRLNKVEQSNLKPFSGALHEVTVQAVLPERVIVLLEDFSTDEIPISSILGKLETGEKCILIEHKKGKFLVKKELIT
ncbi:MAG: NMD3-related protein [Fervidicoccaceae archaeon]